MIRDKEDILIGVSYLIFALTILFAYLSFSISWPEYIQLESIGYLEIYVIANILLCGYIAYVLLRNTKYEVKDIKTIMYIAGILVLLDLLPLTVRYIKDKEINVAIVFLVFHAYYGIWMYRKKRTRESI